MKNYRIIGRSLECQEDAITTYVESDQLVQNNCAIIYTTAERIQWLCTVRFSWGVWSTGTCTLYLQVPHGISF